MSYLTLGRCDLERVLWREDKGEPRPIIENGLLREKDGVWELLGTDSYVCAVVRLELVTDGKEPPVAGPISGAAMRAIGRIGSFRATQDRIEVFESGGTSGEWFERPRTTRFPDVDALFAKSTRVRARINLDAALLKNLANAWSEGDDNLGVQLTIRGDGEPILVQPIVGGAPLAGQRGLLIPIKGPE